MKTLTLATMVALLGLGQTPPDPTAPVVKGTQHALILSWTPPTTDAAGAPLLDLEGYEVALSLPAEDVAAGGALLPTRQAVGRGAVEAELSPLFAGRSPGLYRLWLRALDDAGNPSPWVGAPRLVDWDGTGPAAPGGLSLRVEVRVSVEVTR